MSSFKETVLEEVSDDIKQDVDGFYYWFPRRFGGLGSAELRVVADYLDELNKEWEKKIQEDFEEE